MADITRPSGRELWVAWVVCLVPRLALALWLWPDVRLDTSMTLVSATALTTETFGKFWPPFYPAFAQVVWFVSAKSLFVFMLWHIATHAVIGPCVLVLSRALALGGRASVLAVLAAALLPYYAALATRQLDVGLNAVVAALAVASVAAWRAWGRESWRAPAVAAAAMALFLTRADAFAVAALPLLALWWRPGALPRAAVTRALGVLVLLFLAWSAFNHWAFGRFSPMPPQGDLALWVGNHEGAGREVLARDFDPANVAPPDGMDQPGAPSLAQRAISYAVSHPVDTAMAWAPKFYRYFDPRLDDLSAHSQLERLAYTGPYVIYMPLAVVGAVVLRRRRARWPLAVLGSVVAGGLAVHVLAWGTIRHRMTIEWVYLILAAVAVDALLPAAVAAYPLRRHD